jgi:LmbE family N-acetylglucosaminyl deacetylase
MLNLLPKDLQTVLCLGAHSDDIEIGCGGTVLRLIELFPKARFHWVVFSGNHRRADEARASAVDFLAAAADPDVRTLDFRDGFFPYQGTEIKEAFEKLKAEIQPDLILTHTRQDRHQDHNKLWELTWNTWRGHLVLEYEIPKYDGDLTTPNAYVQLNETHARRKVELLMRHFATQSNKHWFTEDLFFGLMRLRGIESGGALPYAEGFHARKLCCF